MPDLYHTLLKYDIGHLRILAGAWGLELESGEVDPAAEELCACFLDLEAVTETIDILSAEARAALNAVVDAGGRIEWTIFTRKFGQIREMGEARRDREHPHLKPVSVAEILFYRGLIARAFFDTDKGAQEFAYVPEDLFEIIHEEIKAGGEKHMEPPGRPATPVEKAVEIPASDHILDDAATHLAAIRTGRPYLKGGLQELLTAARIIKQDVPQAETVKAFLEAPRADALKMLIAAWRNSQTFDELRLMPALVCEGEWTNQPLVTRGFFLDLINSIPQNKWWSIPAFVRAIKEKFPDYQRPAGDYDSWFIKRSADGQYLRGFAYWDQVDGALIRYFIQTLHWLGMADLASPKEGGEASAFRLTFNVERAAVEGRLVVASDGKITVPRHFSRAVRYQISRFCEWDGEKGDEFHYRATARSLTQVREQGLKAEQLLSLLVKYTNGAVPPALVKALKQWDTHGMEARVEKLLVLRVKRPEILDELRRSKAAKFLGEILSPTAVIIKSGAEARVLAALAEIGLLAEMEP